ncbi:MAG: hypothetical protein AAFY02_17440 [Pseudomonadota bacterium]
MSKQITKTSAAGEIAAIRGYTKQYEYSACELYRLMYDARLDFLSIADPHAGIVDDLVISCEGSVRATQIKTQTYQKPIALNTQLIGNKIINDLVDSWTSLESAYGEGNVRVRYVFGGFFSTSDKSLGNGEDENPVHSARFAEYLQTTKFDLQELESSRWSNKLSELRILSALNHDQFVRFLNCLEVLDCRELEKNKIVQFPNSERRRIEQIRNLLPQLVANSNIGDLWSEEDLITKLGWSIKISQRRLHKFPIPGDFQENSTTQRAISEAIRKNTSGYISLLGPPGTGKSTLLQRALFSSPDYAVARYLAFVPDERHALGRAEAGEFLNDLTGALRDLGFSGSKFTTDSLMVLRNELAKQLDEASERYRATGRKAVVIVDGLDHVPREETPSISFLKELPPAHALPDGVLFVLGSQHLDIADLNASAKQQASRQDRCVRMAPLPNSAIQAMAQAAGLPHFVDLAALYQATAGHPLTARYFIEAIKRAPDEIEVNKILSYTDGLGRDLQDIYERVWNALDAQNESRRVLALLARAEGTISAEALAKRVNETAVEDVLRRARFLLDASGNGHYSIFHNSFRLFIGSQTNQRFGETDSSIEQKLNQDLADMAADAPEDDPQYWMQLRYKARADDPLAVLKIGTAEYFRNSVAAYRPYSDVLTDLRLVYRAVGHTRDRALLLNKLLISKELDYRYESMSETNFVDLFLTLDRQDLAIEHALSGVSHEAWVTLVDDLWDDGEEVLAGRVFEANEPLETLFSNEGFNADQDLVEACDWIQRAYRFRPLDSLISFVEALPVVVMHYNEKDKEEKYEARVREVKSQLIFSLARGVILDNIYTDVSALCSYLGIGKSGEQQLNIEVAEGALRDGDIETSRVATERAIHLGSIDTLHISWRLAAALSSKMNGLNDIAKLWIRGLRIPSITQEENTYQSADFLKVCQFRYQLVLLGEVLEVELANAKESKADTFFRKLEVMLDRAATIQGRIEKGGTVNISDLRTIVYFLAHSVPGLTDRYLFDEILEWLGGVIGRISISLDERGLGEAITLVDQKMEQGQNNLYHSVPFRFEFALTMFEHSQNLDQATRRLGIIAELPEFSRTPHQAIALYIRYAKTFAQIGLTSESWSYLEKVHSESFGYFLRAKKEPQYEFWGKTFRHACEAAPNNAGTYGRVFGRFILGMDQTEGDETARRVVDDLLIGASSSPKVIANLVPRLIDSSLTSWAKLASGVLAGVSKSDPSLSYLAIQVFSNVVIPYYDGYDCDFLEIAFRTLSASRRKQAVHTLKRSVLKWCPLSQRHFLLEKLISAVPDQAVELKSASAEALAQLNSLEGQIDGTGDVSESSRSSKIDVSSLEELISFGEGKSNFGDSVDYTYLQAGRKLATHSSKESIQNFIQSRPQFMEDVEFLIACSRSMFHLDERQFSDELFLQAEAAAKSGYWPQFYGGQKLQLQDLRIEREGNAGRERGYDVLIEELSSGQTAGPSLFLDLDRIMRQICVAIPYTEFWNETASHLKAYREYRLADPVSDSEDVETHSDLLAWLLAQPFGFSCGDILAHSRAAAIAVAEAGGGSLVLETLCRFIERDHEGAREAASLCYRLRHVVGLKDELISAAQRHADHGDFVVALQGRRVLRELDADKPSSEYSRELSAFYSLQLDTASRPDDFDLAPGSNPGSRPVWSDDPWTWTSGVGFPVKMISNASGFDLELLRRRCAEFMRREGGGATFGPTAEMEIGERLSRMDLRMSYRRPMPMAALRGIGKTLGELVRASRVDLSVIPIIWAHMGGPSLMDWRMPIEPRPDWIVAPRLPHSERHSGAVEEWLVMAEEDLYVRLFERRFVLGETSLFRYSHWRDLMESFRLSLPFQITSEKTDEYLVEVPRLQSIDSWEPTYQKKDSRVLCCVEDLYFGELPNPILTLCPYVMSELGWSRSGTNPFDVFDEHENLMITTLRWVDGADRQGMHDREAFGRGHVVLASPAARSAIEGLRGKLRIGLSAVRKAVYDGNEARTREVSASYSAEALSMD